MYQKLDFVLGFFIVIICLSSVVVTLTILYFSRPKSKDMSVKNDNNLEKPKNKKIPESNVEPIKPNNRDRNIVTDTKIPTDFSVQTTAEKISLKLSEPIESNIVNKINLVVKQSAENQPEKLIINKLSTKESPSQSDSLSEKKQSKQIFTKDENHSTPKIMDISTTPSEIMPLPPITKDKTTKSVNTPEQKLETNPEKGLNLVPPPIKQNIEHEVKEQMTDENKKDQPRIVQPDMGFSELFTEDTEENQASKLSKELSDIDANDILTMSQSLVSQFRGKRPVTK
jgi:hypothetical protein